MDEDPIPCSFCLLKLVNLSKVNFFFNYKKKVWKWQLAENVGFITFFVIFSNNIILTNKIYDNFSHNTEYFKIYEKGCILSLPPFENSFFPRCYVRF